jgi:threonine/homoserine/homoserine lactone efflux protein
METPLLALIGFAFAASVTPGPNNMLVAANAAANGVRATLPHMVGIGAGFAFMIMVVGLGLAGVLAAHPRLAQGMRLASMAWLVWLAWKIASAPVGAAGAGAPGFRFGFVKAVLFQWVNPKAWLLALSIAAAWVRPDEAAVPQLLVFGAVFFVVTVPSCVPWALLGHGAARVLGGGGGRMRVFNIAMAVLLVGSMVPMVLEW